MASLEFYYKNTNVEIIRCKVMVLRFELHKSRSVEEIHDKLIIVVIMTIWYLQYEIYLHF